jgi:sodium-coupled neutral amino acid transporter 2
VQPVCDEMSDWESVRAGDVMSGPASGGKGHAGVLPEWFGPHWWTGREAVLVAAAVILLPLVLQKRVGTSACSAA